MSPETHGGNNRNPAEVGQGLRKMMLTSSPEKLGIKLTEAFKKIYGVLMDWPTGQGNIASVVSLSDGNASIYTNGTFGVIGGIKHENIRKCAVEFVKMAQEIYTEASSTSDYSYPKDGRVKFYFCGYEGLRVIDADLDLVSRGQHKLSALFRCAQYLIGLFRQLDSARKQ